MSERTMYDPSLSEEGYEWIGEDVYCRLLNDYQVEVRLQRPGTEIVLDRAMLRRMSKQLRKGER